MTLLPGALFARFTTALLISATLTTALFAPAVSAQDFARTRADRLGFDRDRLQQMDDVLQSYIDKNQIAGSVALILKDGRIAYSSAKGMQNIAGNVPMQEDSLFRIASQTKAIVSTGIMILHERGDLNIADPLSQFFPEWANAKVGVLDDNGGYTLEDLTRPINLRDLLTHTSGIGYGEFGARNAVTDEWVKAGITGWYLANRTDGIQATVRKMADLPLLAQPGTQWIYGYNIDILGAVIEVASGKPLDVFLDEEIFTPLGMNDTHFFLPPEKASRLTTVYQGLRNGGIEPAPPGPGMNAQGEYVNGPRLTFSGGAGLVSTASDYAKFLQMTLNGGTFNGNRILGPKTIELMTSDHLRSIPFQPGTGMGLGFSVLKDVGARGTMGDVGEYGWGGAYHSTYWVDPENAIVVVYLTQILAPAPGLDDFQKLRARLYSALVE